MSSNKFATHNNYVSSDYHWGQASVKYWNNQVQWVAELSALYPNQELSEDGKKQAQVHNKLESKIVCLGNTSIQVSKGSIKQFTNYTHWEAHF